VFVGLLPDAGGMLTGLAVLVSLAAQASSGLDPVEWPLRPAPPSRSERHCTDYSRMFWSVSLDGGVPRTEQLITREHVDPLPFAYAEGRDRQGSRYVARVTDGWLVGFDAGEFGGGLWWFSERDGHESRRIRPSPSAPANPDDPFRAENVLGLPAVWHHTAGPHGAGSPGWPFRPDLSRCSNSRWVGP
jgi:hypothetical protein